MTAVENSDQYWLTAYIIQLWDCQSLLSKWQQDCGNKAIDDSPVEVFSGVAHAVDAVIGGEVLLDGLLQG